MHIHLCLFDQEDHGRAIKLIRKALEDVVKHDDSKIKIKEVIQLSNSLVF